MVKMNTMYADNDDISSNTSNLQLYLREIGRLELPTQSETEKWAIQYSQGDKSAGTKMILANLRLVVKVVSDYQQYWTSNFLDLIQEGNVGLTRAVDKYDPHRGVKFSSYAAYWIRAHVLKFIMDNWRLVKIGTTQAQRKLFFKLNSEKKMLEAQGIQVDSKMLSKRLDVAENEVVEMDKRLGNSEVSLESPIRPDSNEEQIAFLAEEGPSVEDIVAAKDFNHRLHQILNDQNKGFSERERVILYERLMTDDGRTLRDIADQFEISRERVRQVELALLKKLKASLAEEMPVL
jgi:RNA polymerase sigma-32 factor